MRLDIKTFLFVYFFFKGGGGDLYICIFLGQLSLGLDI